MRPTESIALRREPGHLIRSLAALLLRLGLGMVFLMAGLQKLDDMTRAAEPPDVEAALIDDGLDLNDADDEAEPAENGEEASPPYPDSIRGMFAGTFIARDLGPAFELFLAGLPFVEVALGAMLIAGLFTTLGAFATGLVLLSLTFGWIVKQETSMYPNMLIYLLVDVGILWLSPITSNYISLDGLIFGFFWTPKDEGEYRREYEAPAR